MTEQIVFRDDRTFKAYHAACRWCNENGFSTGSMCGHQPIGILRGDAIIAKWRNLSQKEISVLDGKMTGDMRNGPVTVTIF
jgi:hypothetical protein